MYVFMFLMLIAGPNIRSWKAALTRILERRNQRQRLNQVITYNNTLHTSHQIWSVAIKHTNVTPRFIKTTAEWHHLTSSTVPNGPADSDSEPTNQMPWKEGRQLLRKSVYFAFLNTSWYTNVFITMFCWPRVLYVCAWAGTWKRWDTPTPYWTCAPNVFVPFWVATAQRLTDHLPANSLQKQNLAAGENLCWCGR